MKVRKVRLRIKLKWPIYILIKWREHRRGFRLNSWNIWKITYVYSHCNICNIQMKHLQHVHILATHVYSHCNICNTISTFATSRWNICNMCLKQLKHLKHILATHVYSHCNICNTWSTFATSRWNICNIHLKCMKHTVATCAHLLASHQWTVIEAEPDVGMEVGSWLCAAQGVAERSARHEA